LVELEIDGVVEFALVEFHFDADNAFNGVYFHDGSALVIVKYL
jgi:hypothetical protein